MGHRRVETTAMGPLSAGEEDEKQKGMNERRARGAWGHRSRGVLLTVPDLNVQHQIKHILTRPWEAVSGYGMEQIDEQPSARK